MVNVVNSEKSQLVTRERAAEILNVKTNTLTVWACRGCGPAYVKVGRSVRYRLSDLESYIENSRVATTSQS